MQRRLLAPVTGRELIDALRGLARDSCPGEDGLVPAFFIRHWETLEEGAAACLPRDHGEGHHARDAIRGYDFPHPQGGGKS